MKKLYILIGLFIVLLIIFIVSLFLTDRSTPPDPFPQPEDQITVVKTSPENDAVDVPVSLPASITFSKFVSEKDILVEVAPKIKVSVEFNGSTVTITPDNNWQKGTPYWIVVRYKNTDRLPYGFGFTTEGLKVTALPDTRPDQNVIDEENTFVKENYPDMFLANNTPYGTDVFSIESHYNSKTEKFEFAVEPIVELYQPITDKDVALAKQEAEKWMRSIGLTNEQIQSLSIIYIQ